jgi:hypothetical protein
MTTFAWKVTWLGAEYHTVDCNLEPIRVDYISWRQIWRLSLNGKFTMRLPILSLPGFPFLISNWYSILSNYTFLIRLHHILPIFAHLFY